MWFCQTASTKFRTTKISSEGLSGCNSAKFCISENFLLYSICACVVKGEGEPGYKATTCNCRVFDVRSDSNNCTLCDTNVHVGYQSTAGCTVLLMNLSDIDISGRRASLLFPPSIPVLYGVYPINELSMNVMPAPLMQVQLLKIQIKLPVNGSKHAIRTSFEAAKLFNHFHV